MRKRRVILILLGVVVAGAIVVLCRREREPSYGGKRLSEWVEKYANPPRLNLSRGSEEAGVAIRHIGPAAIPYLLRWMRYETPAWRAKVSGHLEDIFYRFDSRWDFSLEDRKASRAASASSAFKALGPKAESAVPELTRMLGDAQNPQRTVRATVALSGIGAAGLPPLMTAVNSTTNFRLSIQAAYRIGGMGAEARPAVPDLLRCLTRKNAMQVQVAATVLGMLELEPDLVVPALVDTLQAADSNCRLAAASSLGRFGTNATSAASFLVPLLTDPDPRVRTAVTNALRQIDPEVLKQAIAH